MRFAKPERGQYLICVTTLVTPLPRSRPAQQLLPLELFGPSKKVFRLPSNTFAMVLPRLLKEPEVPMIAPVNLLEGTLGVALTSPEFALSPAASSAETT